MVMKIRRVITPISTCQVLALGLIFSIVALAFRPSHRSITNTRLLSSARIASALHSAISPEDALLTMRDADTEAFTCDFCKTSFPSRNAVFRHLRIDRCSSTDPRVPCDSAKDLMIKQSIAIQFGYVSADEASQNADNAAAMNEWAGHRVLEALQGALDAYSKETDGDKTTGKADLDFRLQESRTQSSVARHRSGVLHQDPDCAASSDVLIIKGSCLQSSLPLLEEALSKLPYCLDLPMNAKTTSSKQPVAIRLVSCKLLASDFSMHAERSCTQLVYHYLVPLSWLPDAELLQKEWRGWEEKPPTDSLRHFKAALRSAESGMISGETADSPYGKRKVAGGRFGRLGAKEKRPWHNFANPTLYGKASPSQEPVWRVIDTCRMIDIVNFGEPNASLVVEIKGDAFLPTQARRIIGTALAITHGWLPNTSSLWDDFLLSPEHVVETVIAPSGHFYLADCRFHFEESRTSGKPFFESDICGKVIGDGTTAKSTKWVQRRLLAKLSSDFVQSSEEQWLTDVRSIVAPRILASLQQHNGSASNLNDANTDDLEPVPQAYAKVLEQLRNIVEAGRWPDTSVARSTVIRNTSQQGMKLGKAGSFTVITPEFLDKLQASDSHQEIVSPLGNQLFPEFVEAVFELEEALLDQTGHIEVSSDGQLRHMSSNSDVKRERPPQSTHCAVNCNAQFTPHVDSGRGSGQSLSIIVGLGDYKKGELFVEGLPIDIRYNPLQFDGWTLRHWTNQYIGERFSLVWFSPEVKQ